uniref:Coiled-coil domain-containing protein 102B n=1 Tax=Rhabditophanes sp. KR3021 TaxID=114890 RepID=A0AC35U4C9_9BILA
MEGGKEEVGANSNVHNRYYEGQASTNDESLFTQSMGRCQHTDWDVCESVRLAEINEVRKRSAQMEKTMRWWSECTATWRAKWNQVRNERNKCREEAELLRNELKLIKNDLQNQLIIIKSLQDENELLKKSTTKNTQ